MALGARRWLSSIFADLLATLHTAESERCVAAVAAIADCVSCSITMVHCEVGELDFVTKFDHSVAIWTKALKFPSFEF